MSAPYGSITTPAPVPRRTGRRFRTRHGFLLLIVLALAAVGIQVLLTPWAFHLGGSFTPSMSWTSMASGTAPNGGGRFAVQIKLQANNFGSRDCDSRGCADFSGSATICTAAGAYQFHYVSGNVGGWTSVDNQNMMVEISNGTNPLTKDFDVVLRGVWHGDSYVATEGGTLVQYFDAGGAPRSSYTSANPADLVHLTFAPGDFTAACTAVRHA